MTGEKRGRRGGRWQTPRSYRRCSPRDRIRGRGRWARYKQRNLRPGCRWRGSHWVEWMRDGSVACGASMVGRRSTLGCAELAHVRASDHTLVRGLDPGSMAPRALVLEERATAIADDWIPGLVRDDSVDYAMFCQGGGALRLLYPAVLAGLTNERLRSGKPCRRTPLGCRGGHR